MQAARELASGALKRSARKPGVMEWLLERNPLGRALLFSQARKAVAKASGGHYPAPFGILDAVRTGIEQGVPAGLDYEATRFGSLGFTPESAALRGLFFAQTATKKNPYKAEDAPGRKVDTVGVLGAGLMGAGIAHVTAVAGECVVDLRAAWGRAAVKRAPAPTHWSIPPLPFRCRRARGDEGPRRRGDRAR